MPTGIANFAGSAFGRPVPAQDAVTETETETLKTQART